jgi:FKBP-type peptidyl-prolyl cis-trans isomerase FkpA
MRLLSFFLPAVLLAQGGAPPAKAPATPPKAAGTGVAKAPAKAPAKTGVGVPKAAPAPALGTDDEKTIYALGLQMYKSLGQFDLSPAEMEILKKALTDAAAGKPALDAATWMPKVGALAGARGTRAAEKQKTASKAYLAKCAAEPGAVKTESGIVYTQLRAGTGASPKASDTVKVHYRGTLISGEEFDSSYKRNDPAQFPLTNVIKCWTEGVQKIKVGGKAQLVCPSDVAYGDAGRPPQIPGGATLIFEIELLDIVAPGGR